MKTHPRPQRPWLAALALALLASPFTLLAPRVEAQATGYPVEDFETDTLLQAPTGPYTYNLAGNYVTNAVALGSQSLRVTTAGSLRFPATFCNTGQSISFAFNLARLPTGASDELRIGINPGGPIIGLSGFSPPAASQSMGISVGANGVASLFITSGTYKTLSFTSVIAANTWHNATLSQIQCELPNPSGAGATTSITADVDGETRTLTSSNAFSVRSDAFQDFATGNTNTYPSSPTHVPVFLDNLLVTNVAPKTWQSQVIPGLPDTATQLALAHDGERLGLAYKLQQSNLLGFMTRSPDGTWQLRSGNIAGASNYLSTRLTSLGGAAWIVSSYDSTSMLKVFRSTNDGANWTLASSIAGGQHYDLVRLTTGSLGLVTCIGGILAYRSSSDLGSSWSTPMNIGDNRGTPGSTGTASITCSEVTAQSLPNGLVRVVFSESGTYGNVYEVESVNADQFWTVPYYSGGACPCIPSDGATIPLRLWSQGRTNGGPYFLTLARNAPSSVILERNPPCSNQYSLTYAASLLGAGLSESFNNNCGGTTSTAFQSLHQCSASSPEPPAIAGNMADQFIAVVPLAGCITGFAVAYKPTASAAWITSYTSAAVPSSVALDMTSTQTYVVYPNTLNGNQVTLLFASTVPPLQSDAHVTINGLVGFAVDPFDQSIIVRANAATGPATAFDAGLRQVGGFHENMCNRIGGVATRYADGKVFTSFLDCDSTGSVNAIRIRSEILGPPDLVGTPCQGESFCDTDITGTYTGGGGPPQARDLGRLEAAPWDYSLGSTEQACLLCVKHVTLSWAYTEVTGGHVGVYAVTQNKGAEDYSANVIQSYAPPGTVMDDFCAWRDTASKKDYLAAARSGGATKIYQATVTEELAGGAFYHVPKVTLALIHPGNGGFDNAVSLGCSRDRILVLTSSGQAVLTTITGQVLARFSAPNPVVNSAAMSLDGAYGVFGSNGFYHVVDLVNMTESLQFPIPSGVLYKSSLSFNAKTLWSATSLGADLFNLARRLHTEAIPTGSNRDLATGRTLPCTDAQGQPSSTCTGNADQSPTTSTGTQTHTTTYSTSGSATSSTTGPGATSSTSTDAGATGTNSGASDATGGGATSTSGNPSDGTPTGAAGGDGAIDRPSSIPYWWTAAGLVGTACITALILTRRRLGKAGP